MPSPQIPSQPDRRSMLRATRPEVAAVFRGAAIDAGIMTVVFHGTEKALTAAGVVDDPMLATLNPLGIGHGRDEHGDDFSIYVSSGGSYSVLRYLHAELSRDDVNAQGKRRKLWRQHGAAVTAVVDAAIARWQAMSSGTR